MSVNTGKGAQGVVIKMSDGAGTPVFTTVANVMGMTSSGQTMEMIDATHLDSTDGFREYLPSFKDGGTYDLQIAWDPTNATLNATTGLKAAYDDKALTDFKIDCTGAGVALVISFSAYVSNLGFAASVGQILTRPVQLRVSGAVVETAS
jgi:hypothetical protein